MADFQVVLFCTIYLIESGLYGEAGPPLTIEALTFIMLEAMDNGKFRSRSIPDLLHELVAKPRCVML